MTGESLTALDRSRGSAETWDMETKPNVETLERGMSGVYLSCFDMLLTEDAAWLVKVSEASSVATVPMIHMEPREEPEQCPVIDSQEQGLSPGLEGQEEERSLEQVQSMVVGEVLKDIETACKLLNITPGRLRHTCCPFSTFIWALTVLPTYVQRNICQLYLLKKKKTIFKVNNMSSIPKCNLLWGIDLEKPKPADLTPRINSEPCGQPSPDRSAPSYSH